MKGMQASQETSVALQSELYEQEDKMENQAFIHPFIHSANMFGVPTLYAHCSQALSVEPDRPGPQDPGMPI